MTTKKNIYMDYKNKNEEVIKYWFCLEYNNKTYEWTYNVWYTDNEDFDDLIMFEDGGELTEEEIKNFLKNN